MSHLRTAYHTIRFPIVDTRPECLLALYRSEFGMDEPLDETDVITIFSHALRDYLDTKLSTEGFGSICFSLVTAPNLDKLITRTVPELRSIIWDCVDIVWLSGSEHFDVFKKHLGSVLETLG